MQAAWALLGRGAGLQLLLDREEPGEVLIVSDPKTSAASHRAATSPLTVLDAAEKPATEFYVLYVRSVRTMRMNGPVIAQLSSSDPNAPCYEETFLQANVIKNNTTQFKAKTP